jgi:hypothetical protein
MSYWAIFISNIENYQSFWRILNSFVIYKKIEREESEKNKKHPKIEWI